MNVYFTISLQLTVSYFSPLAPQADTSESLNFISPSSTREDFTAGITERCRKLQQPVPLTPKLILNQPINQRSTTTTAYFDIDSGKTCTIVSRPGETNSRYFNGLTSENFLSTKTIELQSPTVVAHANKKPSYLNLACCVNGYSNYTNYDSFQRKEINKSRDVSPIRPIINSMSMARQQRSNDNLLAVPAPVTFVKQSPLTSITKRFASLNMSDKDTTDNAGMINGNGTVTSRKSFIQQRVEKLYGTTKILTTVKSSDSIQLNGNGTIQHTTNGTNGTNGTSTVDEKENDEISLNSLPVMKHLNGRPEFCKQLQFLNSPKKSLTRTSTGNVLLKSEQQQLKSEIITSGNTNPVTSKPPKTNEVSLELSNSESVKKDCESLMDKIMSCPAENVAGEVKIVNNYLAASNNNIITDSEMEIEEKSPKAEIKDGHYFLKLLYVEKARILKIAEEAEKELEMLQANVSAKINFCFQFLFHKFFCLSMKSR